ncbi:MAG: hypothetical protein WCJ56_10370 [bacterium]
MRIFLLVAVFSLSLPLFAAGSVDFELGTAENVHNVFRIPGVGGTWVSLPAELQVNDITYERVRVNYLPDEHTTWSVLYAPLKFHASGVSSQLINFDTASFPAGTALEGSYKFNSYRLSYTYVAHPERTLSYGYGYTLKVRDAAITLNGGDISAESSNVGLVPLLNFRVDWQLDERSKITFDGDALVAPMGRAEDVALAYRYAVTPETTVRVTYRILEGGADNDNVYNFAQVNYTGVGVEYKFK